MSEYYPPPPVGWEYAVLHLQSPHWPREERPTSLDRPISGRPSWIDEECRKNCLLVMVKQWPSGPSIRDLIAEFDDEPDDPDWHPCVLTGQFTAECRGECRG